MSSQTTLEITESVTDVAATGDTISINLTDDVTTVQAYTLAVPFEVPGQITAANVTVVPFNTITSTNLRDALKELADQDFRGASTPTGSNIQEGDTWYDTDDDQFKVYRETSTGVFQWVPIMVRVILLRLSVEKFSWICLTIMLECSLQVVLSLRIIINKLMNYK